MSESSPPIDEPIVATDHMPLPDGVAAGSAVARRINIALFLAGFATFSLLYGVQPLLEIFARHFGVGAAEASLALSLSTMALAGSIMLAAVVAERIGRRPLMFASLLLASLCTLIAAIAPQWHMLLAARLAAGFCMGGVPAVAMAYLAEEMEPRALGGAVGLYVAGNAFGGMAGRVLTGMLADPLGWRASLFLLGLIGLASAIGFRLLLPASRRFTARAGLGWRDHMASWGSHVRDRTIAPLLAVGFVAMGAFVATYNYAGFRLAAPPYKLSKSAIGAIFIVYIFGIIMSSRSGAMAERLGRGRTIILGLTLMACGIGITMFSALTPIVLGIALLTVGFFITHPIASGWVSAAARRDKGHASSLYLLSYYAGSSIAGSVGGWFWTAAGWPGVAIFAVGLVALGIGATIMAKNAVRPAPCRPILH